MTGTTCCEREEGKDVIKHEFVCRVAALSLLGLNFTWGGGRLGIINMSDSSVKLNFIRKGSKWTEEKSGDPLRDAALRSYVVRGPGTVMGRICRLIVLSSSWSTNIDGSRASSDLDALEKIKGQDPRKILVLGVYTGKLGRICAQTEGLACVDVLCSDGVVLQVTGTEGFVSISSVRNEEAVRKSGGLKDEVVIIGAPA